MRYRVTKMWFEDAHDEFNLTRTETVADWLDKAQAKSIERHILKGFIRNKDWHAVNCCDVRIERFDQKDFCWCDETGYWAQLADEH